MNNNYNQPPKVAETTTTNAITNAGSEDEDGNKNGSADFESAIAASGFGLFNILVLLVTVPACTSAIFETSTISYILPSAECDLNLDLLDKGVLNAITYAGMITSAVVWGFVSDATGRRRLLILGYLLDGLCVLGGATSQGVIQLMVFKYLGGFVACGPFAVLMTYVTELHGKEYRSLILMIVGMMFSIGSFLLPVLALLILPQKWDFQFIGLTFHSWQIFLAISSIPAIVSGTLLIFFPESPKFLMSKGKNNEALEVFRIIYAINKREPKDKYPITELINEMGAKTASTNVDTEIFNAHQMASEKAKKPRSLQMSLRNGLSQLRPLFTQPYLNLSLQVYCVNFCILLAQNTTRLWLPQLFASIVEYQLVSSETRVGMCTILEYNLNKTAMANDLSVQSCEVILSPSSYTNNFIVAAIVFSGYILASSLVNWVGSKLILNTALIVGGVCGIGLYWSGSALTTLFISATFVTMGSISSTSLINTSVILFPTSLRTMIVSTSMMFGRTGSLIGNILFPTFISLGCIAPFLMLSVVMFLAAILSIFLPNTQKMSLK